jgi:DNA gyrase/topoisomerase IV subunit A
MQIQKPQDIEKIARDFQYKYIELQSSDGRKLAHYNNTPARLGAKIKDINSLLSKQPDGLYYLNYKISPKGDIFQFAYNKGNINLSENSTPIIISPPVQNINNLEKFQTLQEWKRQEQEISELKNKIALMEMERNFNGVEEEQEEPKNSILGFAENILPTFMPIIDKYLSLREREVKVNEQKVHKPMYKKVVKFRPIPNITDPNFSAYEAYFSKLSDQAASEEMNFLETNNKPIFDFLNRKYYEESNEI